MSRQRPRPIAIVTGASGGIGYAIARRLSMSGFFIVAHFATSRRRVEALLEQVRADGGDGVSVQADLETPDGPDQLMARVDELPPATGQLTALVNNAGKLLGPAFGNVTSADFDAYFSLNTRAPLRLVQLAGERMRNGGGIVNISSAATHFTSPSDIVYAMSKAATEALTFHAAPALAERGIRINTVLPGFTDNGHPLFQDVKVRPYLDAFSLLGGVSSPEAVAEVVDFALSPSAGRMTGATLDVSAGSALAAPRASGISIRAEAGKTPSTQVDSRRSAGHGHD